MVNSRQNIIYNIHKNIQPVPPTNFINVAAHRVSSNFFIVYRGSHLDIRISHLLGMKSEKKSEDARENFGKEFFSWQVQDWRR